MGGIGSGGQNRKSAEEHKRRGTYQPVRHAEHVGDVVPIPVRAPKEVPDAPKHLGPAGNQLWRELWLHLVGLDTERDYALVALVCEGQDQIRAAYQDWMNSRLNKGGKPYRPADPKLARVLSDLRKGFRQDMALLGMSAKDRQAMSKKVEAQSSIEQMKQKVVQLRRPS